MVYSLGSKKIKLGPTHVFKCQPKINTNALQPYNCSSATVTFDPKHDECITMNFDPKHDNMSFFSFHKTYGYWILII